MNATTIAHLRPFSRHRVPIDDGRWVSIRPIEHGDGPGLSDFYARLSPESRRRRFLGSARPTDRQLFEAFIEHEGEGFVGTLEEHGPNDGAVVAHASVQTDGHGGAEIAFAVVDELQGRGIGTALVRVALEHARSRGIKCATATLFTENVPMRRLLRGAGCDILSDEIDSGVEELALAI